MQYALFANTKITDEPFPLPHCRHVPRPEPQVWPVPSTNQYALLLWCGPVGVCEREGGVGHVCNLYFVFYSGYALFNINSHTVNYLDLYFFICGGTRLSFLYLSPLVR